MAQNETLEKIRLTIGKGDFEAKVLELYKVLELIHPWNFIYKRMLHNLSIMKGNWEIFDSKALYYGIGKTTVVCVSAIAHCIITGSNHIYIKATVDKVDKLHERLAFFLKKLELKAVILIMSKTRYEKLVKSELITVLEDIE